VVLIGERRAGTFLKEHGESGRTEGQQGRALQGLGDGSQIGLPEPQAHQRPVFTAIVCPRSRQPFRISQLSLDGS